MNYLVDTQVLIWALTNPKKLSKATLKLLEQENTNAFVSPLSFWEISLKYALGKLDQIGASPDEVPGMAKKSGFEILDCTSQTTATFHKLQPIRLKIDPFDRMLVWQAICSDTTLISQNMHLEAYRQQGLKIIC